MKKKIQAVTASLTALSTIMGMSFAIPSVVSASSEVETGYVEAALYDFENDSSGTPQCFASKKDSVDEYPEIEGRGKVYRVTAIKQDEAAIKIIDGLSLPENYEIQADIYSETPSAGKSAGIYVISDANGANEGSILAVRPNHDTNKLDVLANAAGTLKIESFDAGVTLTAETWYTIRARLEGDSFLLYISDDENEYTVCEDLTSIGGVNISDIRKYAFTAGLRPYGTTCMYDNFRILLPGLIGRYELADTVEATAVTETVSDENASDGGYVSISGAEGDTAAFEITPPGEGEYYVYAGYKASPEYGKAQLKLVRGGFPTTELGEIDMSSDTEEFREVKLADASFAGTDVMQLVLTLGGAAASIDYLRLEEIPEDLFNASKGTYTIREDQPQQTIWGLGVEIQSDSIASGNQGIDDDNYVSVPHDLVQSERERLATEMLSGFRYLRMAGGLYYRGMTEDGKNLTQRWDTQNAELKLFYDEPGEKWDNDALPIGNGYMGAMLFGGVTKDTIQFNEETMFSGKPSEPDTEAYTYLEEIRELIREGKLYEAQQVADKDWLKTASYGTTTNFGSYQNFGNVSVSLGGSGNVSNYRRELDLNNAVSTVSYSMDGANYKRTYFASYPERVVAIRYECDKENGYDATITFDKGHTGDVIAAAGDDVLTMSGSLTNLDYEAKLKVIPEGGTVTADGSSLKVSGATSFVILLTASTDYLALSPTYRGKDYKAENENVISKCSSMSFEELKAEHIADYSSLFGRNVLSLNDQRSDVPTDQRLSDYKQGKSDTGLEALLYQYGRYMLVSSSREGTLPANLQGVWNNSNDPEWGSMFCYNINLNMNYWCAQNTNLSECHTAEIDFIDGLRESGRESAKAYFDCDGWFTSKKSDIWGFTMPYGESVYGLSVGGSGWLCEDVWEYYNYNRDEDYLREKAYPIMRESAEFYLDYLTENDEG